MSSTLEQLTAQALELPVEQRAVLAEALLESIEPVPPLSPEWEAEIARRVAEVDAGRVELIPADEVFARLDDLIASHAARHADA